MDGSIALAAADLDGDGQDDFVYGNEQLDRVSVQFGGTPPSPFQTRDQGILAPGAVQLADLNGDGRRDLVVANSGSNNVLVYLGLPTGQFGATPGVDRFSFFTGTSPAGVTIADLNGDGAPDLVVANEGSNDVTVLLGQGSGITWTLTNGPRLDAGVGPTATVARDVTGDGVADVLVSNRLSDNVLLLPGVGGGFFDDQAPRAFPTGAGPGPLFVGDFDDKPGLDLVTLNAGSDDLTFYSDLIKTGSVALSIASGGDRPVAAVLADFNEDGLDDLLVANNGDGVFALFLGSAAGPDLDRTLTDADVPRPTALALTRPGAGNLRGALANSALVFQVYASTVGVEAAFPLDLRGPVSVTLTAAPLGASPGQPVTLTAAVAPFGSKSAPTGFVTFLLDGVPQGTRWPWRPPMGWPPSA